MPLPSRDEALTLLYEWIESESLRRHNSAVESAMRAYALHYGEDEDLWGVTGLLHDLDYERHPDMDDAENGHPRLGAGCVLDQRPDLMADATEAYAAVGAPLADDATVGKPGRFCDDYEPEVSPVIAHPANFFRKALGRP